MMKLRNTALLLLVQIGVTWCCMRRGTECIDYDVVTKNLEYEERQYPSTVWVSAKQTGPSLSRAQISLYRKLFRYIQGDNLKGAFINSTTPTRTKVEPCRDDSICEPTYTMSLLIPSALYQDLFPIPTDPDLFFEREPPKRYLVRSFGGRPSESQWIDEAQALADLTSKENGVARDHYYLNWYDPPLQLFNRLNEVWITKEISIKKNSVNKVIKDQNDLNEVC
ncbi:heme-binding protein 1-like [Uloborus diversus]|uniref:heme-binding protein 1-like n=1 Tax=Uloborus diversus TaxID=327109 RepID=UPI002409B29F|nr:heme-binding protein 1-like [Uloborus diversus]